MSAFRLNSVLTPPLQGQSMIGHLRWDIIKFGDSSNTFAHQCEKRESKRNSGLFPASTALSADLCFS